MLGEGRPFILQIENARRGMPPPERLEALGAQVLEVGSPRLMVGWLQGEARKVKLWVRPQTARAPDCNAQQPRLPVTVSELSSLLLPGLACRPAPAVWRCAASLPRPLPSWRG